MTTPPTTTPPTTTPPTVTTPPTKPGASLEALVRARLPRVRCEAVVDGDVDVFVVAAVDVKVLAAFLQSDRDAACDAFVDLTVVERAAPASGGSGADVVSLRWLVVCLASRAHDGRVQIRAVLDDEEPVFPTLTGLWPQAWGPEREAWEMFGVTPLQHPSLRRTLLPEGFAGHPGRGRYKLRKSQPQVTPSQHPARVVIDDVRAGDVVGGGRP